MDRVLQAQENALNSFQRNLNPGRVKAIMLYFTGTNQTGETGTDADLGNVVMKRNGRTIVNRPVDVFAHMADIREGSNLFSSTTGAGFTATAIIPFYEKSFDQALNITGDNELNFEWTPEDDGTVFADLTISVYAVTALLPEYYDYFILGDDVTPASAVDSRPYQLNKRNITALYLRDPGSVLTSAGLRQNGKQKFSEQPTDVLEGGTLYSNRLEASTEDMVELQTYTEKKALSTGNRNSILELTTSGTGTIEVTVCSLLWKVDPQNIQF